MMRIDPARTFWVASDWYWRLAEGTTALTLEEAMRDFARPLLRLLDRPVELAVASESLVITIAERETRISLSTGVTDRVAIQHLIADLNRMLADAQLALAFAIVVPRRYELCGTLLTTDELDRLYGDPCLLVPPSRRSSL